MGRVRLPSVRAREAQLDAYEALAADTLHEVEPSRRSSRSTKSRRPHAKTISQGSDQTAERCAYIAGACDSLWAGGCCVFDWVSVVGGWSDPGRDCSMAIGGDGALECAGVRVGICALHSAIFWIATDQSGSRIAGCYWMYLAGVGDDKRPEAEYRNR